MRTASCRVACRLLKTGAINSGRGFAPSPSGPRNSNDLSSSFIVGSSIRCRRLVPYNLRVCLARVNAVHNPPRNAFCKIDWRKRVARSRLADNLPRGGEETNQAARAIFTLRWQICNCISAPTQARRLKRRRKRSAIRALIKQRKTLPSDLFQTGFATEERKRHRDRSL